METIQISEKLYIIDQGPTYTMYLEDGENAVLFDTSVSPSNAKKIDKLINKNITSIYCTHYHADHSGGCGHFNKKYGSEVYLPKGEKSIILNSILCPSMLYGGLAFKEISGHFLQPEQIDEALDMPDDFEFAGNNIKTIPTPGHSPSHTCFLIDNILFAGDAICSDKIIDKYKMLYFFNPEEAVKSLKRISKTDFDTLVYCHKGKCGGKEAEQLIEYNIEHILKTADLVLSKVNNNTSEEIAYGIIESEGIMKTPETALLTHSSVKGYITWLKDQGKVQLDFTNSFRWRKTV